MKTSNRFKLIGIALFVILLFVLFVPIRFQPAGDLRIILDHSKQVYIAPPCYEQANATNNLAETSWSKAKKSGYSPESSCTEELMQSTARTLWVKTMESFGVIPKPWL